MSADGLTMHDPMTPPAPARYALLGRGRSAEVFTDGTHRAVKLFVEGSDPEAIRAEFRAAALAARLGLPVAQPHGVVTCGDRTGIVYDRAEGPTILERCGSDPVQVALTFRSMALLQRRIHACSGVGLPDQREALACEIARARISEAARRAALARLDRLPRGNVLCHGDLHAENVIATPAGWRVVDWQKAQRGHPAADVARSALLIRFGRMEAGGPPAPLRALVAFWYVLCYRQGPGPRVGMADVRAWMLPVAAARLAGRAADNEGALRAEVERLAA